MPNRIGAQRGGRPRKKYEVFNFTALAWRTAEEIRDSIAQLQHGFATGLVTEGQHRSLIHGGRAQIHVLEHLRNAALEDIEQRLDALERQEGIRNDT